MKWHCKRFLFQADRHHAQFVYADSVIISVSFRGWRHVDRKLGIVKAHGVRVFNAYPLCIVDLTHYNAGK